MARYHFDRSGAGVVLGDDAGDLTPLKNLTDVAVYASESGGSPITDLSLDPAGLQPVTRARTDSLGRVSFYGPDGNRGPLWVQIGGTRYAVISVSGLAEVVDAAAQVPSVSQHAANAVAAAQAAQVAASVGLGPVVVGSFVGPPEGQPGPSPVLTWSIASSPIGLRADGVELYQPTGVDAADRAVLAWVPSLQRHAARRLVGAAVGPAPDITAPAVSGVAVAAASTTAALTATTNESATVTVQYGPTSSYGTTRTGAAGTSHNVPMDALTAGTVYHYRYRATDTAGNVSAWSSDATFTTQAAATILTVPNQSPSGVWAWTTPVLTATDLPSADMWGETTFANVSTADRNAAVVLRSNAAGTQYLRFSVSSTRWKIEHVGVTVPTDYNEPWAGPGVDNAGVLRAEINGRVATLLIDGAPIPGATVTLDAAVLTMTGRRGGVQTYQAPTAAVTLNNNRFGTLGSAPPAPVGTGPAVGQAGYEAFRLLGATRSGKTMHQGAWAGGVKTVARQNAIDTFMGVPGDVFQVKPNDTSWATLADSDWAIGDLDGYAGKLVYWLPLLPKDRAGQWVDITGGSRDSVFTAIANQLKAHGRGDAVVMLGPEANGTYPSYAVTWSTAAAYRAAFNRVAGLLLAAAPNLKIAWCYRSGLALPGKPAGSSRTADLAQMYPQEADARISIVECTHFDAGSLVAQNATQWANALNPATGPGLADLRDFARTKGKGFMVGRWSTDKANGPGDNPFFVDQMAAFQNAAATSDILVASLWFNEPDPPTQSQIAPAPSQVPNAGARVKHHWGQPAGAVTGWYAHGAPPDMPLETARSYAYAIYQQFKTLCFKTTGVGGAPAGSRRVARVDQGDDTVSEGIGYGLLTTAVYGNPALGAYYDSTARDWFDGFWRYYNHYKNSNGLMGWRISNSGVILGAGGATDADLDVAMALILAHRLWGSAGAINYASAANTLLTAILDHEFTPGNHAQPNIMKNGDMAPWTDGDQRIDPDYLRFAWFREFATFSGNTRWNTVLAANYPLWNYFDANFSTGMVPNECNRNGTDSNSQPGGLPSYQFGYNAVRLSLNATVDYLWNGSAAPAVAYSQSNKLATWAKGQIGAGAFPGNLGSVYALNGTGKQQGPTNTFFQAYGGAALVNSAHSGFAAQILTYLYNNRASGAYFDTSLNATMSMFFAGFCKPNP